MREAGRLRRTDDLTGARRGGIGGRGRERLLDEGHAPGRTASLLLADGSLTRGARAPGGEDPRGAAVDAELAAALRERRAAHVPDADAVGAAAGPRSPCWPAWPRARPPAGPTQVLHDEAPLGVGYLVAVLGGAPPVRTVTPGPAGRGPA